MGWAGRHKEPQAKAVEPDKSVEAHKAEEPKKKQPIRKRPRNRTGSKKKGKYKAKRVLKKDLKRVVAESRKDAIARGIPVDPPKKKVEPETEEQRIARISAEELQARRDIEFEAPSYIPQPTEEDLQRAEERARQEEQARKERLQAQQSPEGQSNANIAEGAEDDDSEATEGRKPIVLCPPPERHFATKMNWDISHLGPEGILERERINAQQVAEIVGGFKQGAPAYDSIYYRKTPWLRQMENAQQGRKSAVHAMTWRPLVLACLSICPVVTPAAVKAGISPETVYHHQREDADFAMQMSKAVAVAKEMLHAHVWGRVTEGDKEPVYFQGAIVGYTTKYSDMLTKLMMAAHIGGGFAPAQTIFNTTNTVQATATAGVQNSIAISNEKLEVLRARRKQSLLRNEKTQEVA